MAFIQTAQSVDLSHSHVSNVAGHQYNINIYSDGTTPPISNAALDEHTNRIQENVERLHGATESGFQEMNARFDAKEGQPPRARYAAFDCNKDRTRCHEGTRTDVLNKVFRWIGIKSAHDGSSAPGDPQEKSCIFWINGSAGTGKTTISYTIAEECRKCGILGASFFCSRDDSDCSDPGLVFTTIAYQLGIFSPPFKAEVSRVMVSQPDIRDSNISYQIEQLIVNPLRSLAHSIRPCVVVVDALDECRDDGTTSVILSSLARYVTELSPIKFLITSRPENSITTAFRNEDLSTAARRLILHEVLLDVVRDDIMSYLSSKLASTRIAYGIQCEWPTLEDVRELARLSHGLFIFAATSVKFIEDRNYSDPRGQLADLLNAHPETDDGSPHVHLYRLYTQVLNRAFPNISPRLSERLKKVLGSVVLIREPLSPSTLERLIELKRHTVRETLVHLHSIIIVPEDDTRAIRLLHPSFFDFITHPLRCRNPKFVVDTKTQHAFLTSTCLQAMKGLRRDICGIKKPSILNSEVNGLSMRIETNILPHVQYACRHWASHLAQARFSDDLVNLVEEFCMQKLLNWLEVCGLLGELRSALLALNTIRQAVLISGRDMSGTLHLLRDCERFTLEFFPVISSCALQVYQSALLFTPKETAIRKVYGQSLDQSIKIYNAPDETWHPCMRVMEGHTRSVASVAFSLDGTRIVSGSEDHTLRLWDAVSGAHLSTLSGHFSIVNSVAFSPDGTHIVSGSDDGTLRLWDALSSAHLITLSRHFKSVKSVAFSPDGTRIASGSNDRALRLWDAVSGAHLILIGHSNAVCSVAFSPDGTRIASGSDDGTVQLWGAVNGAHLITLSGHFSSFTSVAFSSDGSRIVSGSLDTLQLWDAVNGAHLITLNGHSGFVKSVAFSPDGTHIVSGANDNTLRLWDAASGAHLVALRGHSDSFNSVAFSPDGTRIVSGSSDSTLRLWDAVCGSHLITQDGHSHYVKSVAFSLDDTRIVSGSEDCTVRLWDAISGALLITMSDHSMVVNSVAFSPDCTCIVSGSGDRTVRLWDAVTGALLITLRGHTNWVNSVAFSPDGTHVVSGSSDCTVRLWDVVRGAHAITLHGYSGNVESVAFSPDGTHIASGSHDALQLWDAVSGACLITLRTHSNWVMSVAFSPDGTRIVSGSTGRTLRLWDAVSGELLRTMKGDHWNAFPLARSSWASFSEKSESPIPIFGYLTEDGWIYSLALNRRICWVPVPFRPRAMDVTNDSVVFGTDDGRIVVLRFDMDNSFFLS